MTPMSWSAVVAGALMVAVAAPAAPGATELSVSTSETVFVQDLFADDAAGDIEVRGCDEDQPVELRFAYDRGEIDDLALGVTSRDGVARLSASSVSPWLRFSGAPVGGTVTVFASCAGPVSEASLEISSAVLELQVAGDTTVTSLRSGVVPPPATVGFCREEIVFSAAYVAPVSAAPDGPVATIPILTATVATDETGQASIPWAEPVAVWLREEAPEGDEGSVVLTAQCESPTNVTSFVVPPRALTDPEPSPPDSTAVPTPAPVVEAGPSTDPARLAESGGLVDTAPVWMATVLLSAGIVALLGFPRASRRGSVVGVLRTPGHRRSRSPRY